jgi:hypothetical protein
MVLNTERVLNMDATALRERLVRTIAESLYGEGSWPFNEATGLVVRRESEKVADAVLALLGGGELAALASRLAETERLLRDLPGMDLPEGNGWSGLPAVRQALAVASGAAVQVPLRVLVEWALRGRGWERKTLHGAREVGVYRHPVAHAGQANGWRLIHVAVDDEIEREEAAPAAEATT